MAPPFLFWRLPLARIRSWWWTWGTRWRPSSPPCPAQTQKWNWILVHLIKWKTDYSIIFFWRNFIIFNLVHGFLKFWVWMPIYMHFSKLPLQMDPKLECYLLTTFVPWVLKSSSLSRGPPSVGGGGTCPADRPSTPARYPATTQIERRKRDICLAQLRFKILRGFSRKIYIYEVGVRLTNFSKIYFRTYFLKKTILLIWKLWKNVLRHGDFFCND